MPRKARYSGAEGPSGPYVEVDLTIAYAHRTMSVGGCSMHLTASDYKLLAEICTNAGQLLTDEYPMQQV